jgi:hypothetical protein
MDTTTGRTIEQILGVRLHAAQVRVMERTMALVKDGTTAALIENVRLAEQGVELAQREIDSQASALVERVEFEPATRASLLRYAAVLMVDYAALGTFVGMTAEQAWDQAKQDEAARFEDWYARYGQPEGAPDDEA